MKEFKKVKLTKEQLKEYNENPNIRRRKILTGGFEKIVYASDQDLD